MTLSFAKAAGLAAIIVATAGGGYWVGQSDSTSSILAQFERLPAPAGEAATDLQGPALYYRHPDGLPNYASGPKVTPDGRQYVPVVTDQAIPSPDSSLAVAARSIEPGERKVLYYRNPMGLPDTSPAPKKDSMGMDYIPVFEGSDKDTSSVTISPGRIQRTGVRSEIAVQRPIERTIRVPGSVELDERLVAVVATRAEAFVDRVASVTTGDPVKKGAPLVWLYSPDVSNAGAQYLLAVQDGGAGERGARQRLVNLGVPDEVIESIAQTGEVPISIPWPAPRDGVIVERNVMDGMAANTGTELFKVADLSTVWVVASVPEYELDAVVVGAAAQVTIRSFPGKTFRGRVTVIYPDVATATRTTRVRVEIANQDAQLLPGMYADVAIASGVQRPTLAVPDGAIVDSGERKTVIVDLADGRFEPREVTTGRQGDGYIEILSGIAAGDRVVTSANFLIDAESNLKAAFGTMSAAQGEAQ